MKPGSNISILVSILALCIAAISLGWNFNIDTKLHRPYIGMDSHNTSETILPPTNFLISVPLKNFGDLPGHYSIELYTPYSEIINPFQDEEGYLMPGQVKTFQWSIPINIDTKINNQSLFDLCKGMGLREIKITYGSKNQYFLKLSSKIIDLPIPADDLKSINNPTIGSSTPLMYNCPGHNKPATMIWTVTESK